MVRMRIALLLFGGALAADVTRRVWTETDGSMYVEVTNNGNLTIQIRPERASVRLLSVEEDLEGQQQCEDERRDMEGQASLKTKLLLKLMGALLHQAVHSESPTLLFSYDREELLEWRRLRSSSATKRKLHEYSRLSPEEKNEEGEEILQGLINDPESDMCANVVHWLAPPSFLDSSSHVHCYPHHPCHQVTKQIFISADLGFGVVNFDGKAFSNRGQVVRVLRDLMCHPTLSNFELDDQVRYVGGVSPNDPEFKAQWYLKDTKIDQAWNKVTGKGLSYPLVMVADTGTQLDHPDMKGNLWVNEAEKNGKPGVDDDNNGYIDDIYGIRLSRGTSDGNVTDDDGHGSHCAGSIAAVTNNGAGVAGISWGAKIVTCKFITNGIGYMSDAAKCVDYAVKKGVSLLSSSWGGASELASLTTAVKNATKIVFSFASGNSGYDFSQTNKRVYPACTKLPNTITATGSCENASLIDYGNVGTRCVDLAAPGDYVFNLMIGSSYVYRGGTSMAAPIPIGVMALMLQINKSLSASQLVSIVKSTTQATSGYDKKVSTGGRIDALAAVNAATAATKLSLGDTRAKLGKTEKVGVGESVKLPVFIENIPRQDFRRRKIEAMIDWMEESEDGLEEFYTMSANMTLRNSAC